MTISGLVNDTDILTIHTFVNNEVTRRSKTPIPVSVDVAEDLAIKPEHFSAIQANLQSIGLPARTDDPYSVTRLTAYINYAKQMWNQIL